MKITVISRSPRPFYLEGVLVPARKPAEGAIGSLVDGTAEVGRDALARWVLANRDSEMLRFLRWDGGMEALFPEGHEMRGYKVEKAPRVGSHERGAR